MRIFAKDIKELLKEAIRKFEDGHPSHLFKETNLALFFDLLTEDINEKEHTALVPTTLYKQYHIKLESYQLVEIGCSEMYLNALCRYVKNADYSQVYGVAFQDESEVPEFPYTHPCFPATPTIHLKWNLIKPATLNVDGVRIEGIDEFTNVWIKDESACPLGTFKDRFSWEVYLFYNNYLKDKIDSSEKISIPSLSLISSGNAAIAIQYLLQQKGLPPLRVLVDKNIDKDLLKLMKLSGCMIFYTDLRKKDLSSEEIKELTDNKGGYDLTLGREFEDQRLNLYDWLSYEVLNQNPEHLFIPCGSGDLFNNIYDIWVKELKSPNPSKRFFGNKNILSKCNYFGACTEYPKTQMIMLLAPYHSYYGSRKIREVQKDGFIGSLSEAILVKESFVNPAMQLAKDIGMDIEASGAAGIALFLQMISDKNSRRKLSPKSKILIINTGRLKREIFLG